MRINTSWRGPAISLAIRKLRMDAALDGAEDILKDSINDAPIISGTLRRSGTVTEGGPPANPDGIFESAASGTDFSGQKNEGDGSQQGAVYISFNTPYAAKQHEDMSLTHTDGKAKFLEDNFNAKAPKVVEHMNLLTDAALRKGL